MTETGGPPTAVEDLLRTLGPQVLARLARRYGQFDACEDAVQEALIDAASQWPSSGTPANPAGWLYAVASRRLVDHWRQESARMRREERVALWDTPQTAPPSFDTDDSLTLLLMCAHPSQSAASQLALTLRAVAGLTTAEIARAFFVPEATIAQRISRAKRTLRFVDARFELPNPGDLADRTGVVSHVLYLLFNEGYASSSGPDLSRPDLTTEAIRLARMLHASLPDDGETAGLLSLMLLTDARRDARLSADGLPVPLEDQDRSRWNASQIAEGIDLLTRTLGRHPIGPYQLQASIAAVHDEAPTAADTDWRQIVALYAVLEHVAPSPVVRLNKAVAVAMTDGPHAGLQVLATLEEGCTGVPPHRLEAVRAHLLERTGDVDAARDAYVRAARLTASQPEQRYLLLRASTLAG